MRKLMVTTAVLAMVAASPVVARGGSSHSHSHSHRMHRHAQRALSAPANPAVPPSLTPDARLAGSAPSSSRRQSKRAETLPREKLDPEDAKLDQKIKSICRGC